MKRIITVMLMLISLNASSQGCVADDNFAVVIPYIQFKGAGVEIGMWPEHEGPRLNFFGGIAVESAKKWVQKPEYNPEQIRYILMNIYGKAQYSVNRYVHFTGSAGVSDFSKLYLAGGLRLCAPINQGYNSAIIIEPQYTTRGFNVLAGIAIGL